MQGLLADRRSMMAAHIASQFVGNEVHTQSNDLRKGIVDEFRYGDNSKLIEIKKTGKELKAALIKTKTKEDTKKASLLAKMNALEESIGEAPTEPASNWRIDDYPNLPDQPNTYDVYNKRQTLNTGFGSNESCDDTCNKMYKYNSLVYNYGEACVQVAMLDTLIGNVEDKKTYPLNLKLATMLGL